MTRKIPLWELISNKLISGIENGFYQLESYLPTEHELAEAFGVSRNTIRSSLGDLAAKGYITRTPHRGSKVVTTGIIPVLRTTVDPFIALRHIHAKSRLRVLAIAPAEMTEELKRGYSPHGDDWTVLRCHRMLDKIEKPWNCIDLYLPTDFQSSIKRVGRQKESVLQILKELESRQAVSAKTFLRPIFIPDCQADSLIIPRGTLATEITTLYFDQDGSFFHLSVSVNPVDRFQLELTFHPN